MPQGLCQREDITVRAGVHAAGGPAAPAGSRQPPPLRILQRIDCRGSASLDLLRCRIMEGGVPEPLPEQIISDIFLDNLKTATPWILKQVNIRLLEDYAAREDGPVLHIATHLSNLIKVSDRVTVRHSAGNALLALAPG
ncbi:MAG: hypothetical protein ACLUNQ_06190 [Oscillospiraceae bacterium]